MKSILSSANRILKSDDDINEIKKEFLSLISWLSSNGCSISEKLSNHLYNLLNLASNLKGQALNIGMEKFHFLNETGRKNPKKVMTCIVLAGIALGLIINNTKNSSKK